MNDNITLFYAVLVSLVAPLTGGMILFATSHTRNQSHLLLRLLAVGNLAISALGLFAVVGWGLYHNSRELILMVVGDSLATVLLLASAGPAGRSFSLTGGPAQIGQLPNNWTIQNTSGRSGPRPGAWSVCR